MSSTLTLAEQRELGLAVDGPITPQHIADKIAQRGAPEYVHVPTIREQIAMSTVLRQQAKLNRHNAVIAENSLLNLMAKRAEFEHGATWDHYTARIADMQKHMDKLPAEVMQDETAADEIDAELARIDSSVRTYVKQAAE